MTKKRKAVYKKVLTVFLTLCIVLSGFITNVMPVQAAPVFYCTSTHLKPYAKEIPDWEAGCQICSMAMLLTAMGKSNATPYEVWKNNNKKVWVEFENIYKKYGVQYSQLYYFNGSNSKAKYKELYSLCQKYPYRIRVYAPYYENGNKIDHYIFPFIENNTLYIHDPGYPEGAYCTVEKNSRNYKNYDNFISYRIFTDKGGGTVTPTPTPDPITFQTPTYSNITETTAYVQVNVTADSSQLSKVGMKWDKIVGSTYYHQTEFSWAGSSLRSRISVDFGKEIDKNGNKPTLSPGSTYQCQFFAVTKAGKTLYSTAVRFTTKSAASSDTTPPVISNIKVTPTSGGYYVECDVYDNVGVAKVQFPTWTHKNGQDDLQWPIGEAWSQKGNGTATYVIKINASDHNNEQGYYTTHIYAYDTAGNQSFAAVTPDICVDWTNPTITDMTITDQTNAGYTVQCRVTDNVGVSRVRFPVWTDKNGQDDIGWGEGTKSGDIYSFRVNVSDHNNEDGIYHNHIYAYDAAGNQRSVAAPDCNVDRMAPTISDIKITDQTNTGYTVQCRVTDNVGVSRVRFPVWTDKNGQDDLWWGEGTKSGDIYSFRVNVSDHNNEEGIYHNHIYAYDAAGNERSVAAPDCNISTVTIIKQPDNYVGSVGETAIFRLEAVGSNLRYRWQYRMAGFTNWNDCTTAGSTTPELRYHIAKRQDDQTEFRCVIADAYNTVISQSAKLSVINSVKKCTVTFDSQGGTYVDAITDIVENTKIAVLPNPPARKNFTFAGWYTEPNGQGGIFNENTIIKEDITVYAYWKLQRAAAPKGFWVNDIPAQKYTGKAIKPYVEVYDGTKLLKEKVDYTLSYKNNIKANSASNSRTAPTVVVKGKGNYSGSETVIFAILQKNISSEDVIIDNITKSFDNNLQKPVPIVTWNGKKLKNKSDFTVKYPKMDKNAYIAEGTYPIEIVGNGNYTGKRVVQFTITNKRLMSKVCVDKIPNQSYTGNEITPDFVVEDGMKQLKEDVDYIVSYSNNVEIGTATAVLTGIGAYCGDKRISFKITGIDIRNATVTDISQTVMYTGNSITVNPSLTIANDGNEATLKENQDYIISYRKNKDAGTATVIFKGINNYSGTLKKTFRITPYDIDEDKNNKIETDGWITAVYIAGGSKPSTTVRFGEQILEEGRDYTLKYNNNQVISSLVAPNKLPIITVSGKGNFNGSRTISFKIVPRNMESLAIEVQDKVYQNTAGKYRSIPKITDWNGKALKAGKDYESEISYAYADDTVLSEGIVRAAGSLIEPTDIPPAGTRVMVTVTGKGNYCGKVSAVYRIAQQDFRKAKVKISKQTYTGSKICPEKEQIKINIGQTVLAKTDYEIVGYSNNVKKGTATIILRGTGDYGGIKKATFKIVAKGVKWWWR